jgi:hypothetical protein
MTHINRFLTLRNEIKEMYLPKEFMKTYRESFERALYKHYFEVKKDFRLTLSNAKPWSLHCQEQGG